MDVKEFIKEQYFRSIRVDTEERDFLLELLSNCKDISDSEYGNYRSGKVIELLMEREEDNNDLIHISGSVIYNDENRTIEGTILYYKDCIVFDTKITRLCVLDSMKEYLVLDTFIPTENGYELISHYNSDKKEYIKEIDMKGKVK